MLIDAAALKLPLLYQNLIAVRGPEKGRQLYDELYEASYKKRLPQFKGKTIVDVIAAEIDVFPAFGWQMWMETLDENGSTAATSTLSAAHTLMLPANTGCLHPAIFCAILTASCP